MPTLFLGSAGILAGGLRGKVICGILISVVKWGLVPAFFVVAGNKWEGRI